MDKGYLGLFRKFFDHEFWNEERKYSKAEAWIDLMQSARYGTEAKILFDKRGSYILEYGDIYLSLRYLGKRWQWSKNKVQGFLNYLEKRGSISVKKKDSHRTIIHIIKLNTYREWIEGKRDSEGTVEGQSRDSRGTKKKKVKKENKVLTVAPDHFIPSENLLKWFRREWYWKENSQDLIEACFDNHKSKGHKFLDWEAVIRKWCRNDKEWHPDKYIKAPEMEYL